MYLKSTVKIEPLVYEWYAWPYLIPPLHAACNIVNRHIKIMESYIQNPQIHAQAVKNPKLLGGPFIDLGGEKIAEIKSLITDTKKQCAELIQLNNEYKQFDCMLQNKAIGDSLEVYYKKLPSSMAGLVELVYDLNNHPSIRLIEPLFYKKYYSTKYQKIVLSDTLVDYRQFVLSTPRIDYHNEVYLDLAFSDTLIDQLCKAKTSSINLNDILDKLRIPQSKLSLFHSFFTINKIKKSEDQHYNGDGVRLRYFGHACILIQTKIHEF